MSESYFKEIGAWSHDRGQTLRAYIVGFIISLVLTIGAYALVVNHVESGGALIAAILLFALAQFLIQLVCFLHLGAGKNSRDRLLAVSFTSIVILILVGGSLWIMFNLNGRMMPDSTQMVQYMSNQDGF